MLVADRHAPVQADQLTREQARRLWEFAPSVAEVIVDAGPHLLDVLAATDTLRERLGLSITPQASTETPVDGSSTRSPRCCALCRSTVHC